MGPHLAATLSTAAAWQSSLLLLAFWPVDRCYAYSLVYFMGATFPLLMGVIERTSEDEAERSFSYLYVANVFGALLGTLVSAFVLIELMGSCEHGSGGHLDSPVHPVVGKCRLRLCRYLRHVSSGDFLGLSPLPLMGPFSQFQ